MAKVIFACLVTVRALSFSNKVDVIASPEHGQPAHIGYRPFAVGHRFPKETFAAPESSRSSGVLLGACHIRCSDR
jgi:hypothetical protein